MNWVLTTLFSVIGSILISVISSLVSDRFKQWLAHRSLISKRKRLDELKKQYEHVEKLHADPTRFQIENLGFIFIVLGFISFMFMVAIGGVVLFIISLNPSPFIGVLEINPEITTNITVTMGWIAILISILLSTILTGIFLGHLQTIVNVVDFKKYKQEFNNQVKGLSSRTQNDKG